MASGISRLEWALSFRAGVAPQASALRHTPQSNSIGVGQCREPDNRAAQAGGINGDNRLIAKQTVAERRVGMIAAEDRS